MKYSHCSFIPRPLEGAYVGFTLCFLIGQITVISFYQTDDPFFYLPRNIFETFCLLRILLIIYQNAMFTLKKGAENTQNTFVEFQLSPVGDFRSVPELNFNFSCDICFCFDSQFRQPLVLSF